MKPIPEGAQEVLAAYFQLLDSKRMDFLEAYYIYGSISLGAFTKDWSDIDFVAVVKQEINADDLGTLKEIHRDIQKRFPKIILDGKYMTQVDMQQVNIEEKPYYYFNEGKYIGVRSFHKNSIDAYQLKTHGISIKGQGSNMLEYTVDWNILVHNMKGNLNTYWVDWRGKCARFLSLSYILLFYKLEMVEWGVLGVSRQYYTFKEKQMTSKVGAGEYALQSVPVKWHRIINEAMRLRKGIRKSYYTSIIQRRNDTLDYMNYIIQESNRL